MQLSPFSALLVLALAAVLPGVAAAQQQWKWRDADGRITVSDLPPPREIADKDILQRPDPAKARAARAAAAASAASGPAAGGPGDKAGIKPGDKPGERAADKELDAKKRAAEAERAAKARAEEQKVAAQRAENCQRARAHIASLESGQRVVRTNAQGEREFLDDTQRAAELRRTREIAAAECR